MDRLPAAIIKLKEHLEIHGDTFILTILTRNILPAKLQTNKNPHAQINFAAKLPFFSHNGNPPLQHSLCN